MLAVVSEKTGYPTEMLTLEMSLDHDLGIDSIKRVEILSALQERVPNLPAFKPDELGSLHTLNDVVTLAEVRSAEARNAERGMRNEKAALLARNPNQARSTQYSVLRYSVGNRGSIDLTALSPGFAPIVPPRYSCSALRVPSSALASTVLAVVSEKTGYPTEMLTLEMSLDHDLGIDSIKRVEILSALQERVPNLPAFKPDELGSLHTLNDVVTLAELRSVEARNPELGMRNERAAGQIGPGIPINPAAGIAPALATPVLNTQYSVVSIPNAPASTLPPSRPDFAPSSANETLDSALRAPSSALITTVMEVVSEKTGYPTEMLSLEMSLDHDLGIDSIKRVEILSALQERVADLPAFKPEELGALHTLNDVVMLAEARSAEARNAERGVRNDRTAGQNGPAIPSNSVADKPSSLGTQYSTTRSPINTCPTNGTRCKACGCKSLLTTGFFGSQRRSSQEVLPPASTRP